MARGNFSKCAFINTLQYQPQTSSLLLPHKVEKKAPIRKKKLPHRKKMCVCGRGGGVGEREPSLASPPRGRSCDYCLAHNITLLPKYEL